MSVNEKPRRARLLTKLRINEVSAVDRGAGEGVKIVLMKRDDTDGADNIHNTDWYRDQVAIAERQNAEHLRRNAKVGKSFDEVMADRDAADDPRHAPVVEHHASKVADLLVESGRHPNRAAALDHLLHSARGAALLQRLNKSEEPMKHTTDTWQKIAADHGVVSVAKMITDEGAAPSSLDEHTFTQLVVEYAKRAHPELSEAAAFERVFAATDESGKLLRQAHSLTKAWPAPLSISPVMTGGTDAFPSAQRREGSSPPRQDGTDRGGESSAYDQLVAMAERQRKDGETAAAAFMRVYLDPANASLASAERAQNRPNGGVRIME